jgi:quercetin dioxygenase-like cupin family protein
VSVTEIVVPPHSAGPPLHAHDFDEAFYMLEGELILQVENALIKGRGRARLRSA